MENQLEYIATHLGNGVFECELPNGEKRNGGDNMTGMIRFTYFEDYSMPPIGWSISREQLLKDYGQKMLQSISDGKVKFTK
jgi:hypothetical protein